MALSVHGFFFFHFHPWYQPPQNGLASGVSSLEMVLIGAPKVKKEEAASAVPSSILKKEALPCAAKKNSKENQGAAGTAMKSASRAVETCGTPDAVPSYLHNPQPLYPESELQSGHEGTVILHMTVAATGKVSNVVIATSSGYPLLDKRALETVSEHWSFRPAMMNHAPVVSTIVIPIHFSLKRK